MHARRRHPPLQNAVGRPRGTSLVVRSWRDTTGHYSLAPGCTLPFRAMGMAAATYIDRDGGRAGDSALYPVSWRWVPPACSPVAPRSLIAGIAAACNVRNSPIDVVVDTLCARFTASDALLTDTETSALILALQAMVQPGGTIAFPGYSCIDLTTAAIGAGLQVRLYDLDPATMSPDLESVKRAIERGVDAIVVAHLYGYPADVRAVKELAASHGIPVIEDAAQGAGGTFDGVRLGGLADISILSFGRGKGATTGSGGAILVRSPSLVGWL